MDRRNFLKNSLIGGTIIGSNLDIVYAEDRNNVIDDEPIIETMKNTKYFKEKILNKEDKTFLSSLHMNNFQIYFGQNNYYKEVNGNQRCGLSKEEYQLKPYGVWTCPGKDLSSDDVKRSLLCLIREKIYNDLTTANCLLKELKKDNLLKNESKWPDYEDELDVEDLISFLTSKKGKTYIKENK